MILDVATGSASFFDGATGWLEREATWSPDGARIAFHAQRDDPAGDILVAEVVRRSLVNVRNLTPRTASSPLIDPDVTPAWSPDGSRIAFTGYRSGGAAIWVMNADGSGARQVTMIGAYGDYFPSWSADGKWLAFQRSYMTTTQVGIVSVDGGAPRLLQLPGNAYSPAWSPDGERIALVVDFDGDPDVVVMSASGEIETRIRRRGVDRNPAWSKRVD